MTLTVAGFQIQMIPSCWYIDDQKDKDVAADACYFVNQEAMQNYLSMILTPNPSTIPTTVTAILRCAAKRKSSMEKYGDLCGK